METRMITLRKAMKILNPGEPWTIGTESGEGWIYYYDGKELHDGTRYGKTLEDLYERECVEVYEREERKRFFKADRFMELEAGKAFIIYGSENGTI